MTNRKFGKYPSTKKEEEEMYQFCKSALKWSSISFAAYMILGVIYFSVSPQTDVKVQERNIIDTCEEAKENLRYALDKRDAITPSEAMTSEGMTEWKKWRDRGIDVESEARRLCPTGEPLLSQPSADN